MAEKSKTHSAAMSKKGKSAARRPQQNLNGVLWGVAGILLIALIAGIWLSQQNAALTTTGALPLEISVQRAYELTQNPNTVLLDVRTQEEWNEYHAINAIHIPLDELEARASELPQDKEIVVICRSGNRSQTGRDILLQAGFQRVTSVNGGLLAWSQAGYPIEGTRP